MVEFLTATINASLFFMGLFIGMTAGALGVFIFMKATEEP